MANNIKYLVLLVLLLLVSFWCQGSFDTSSYASTAQESINFLSTSASPSTKRGLETTARDELTVKEIRNPLREDEFWLTESDSAVLPFEVEFVPPGDSWGDLKPMWECHNNSTRTKKLIFVNIVRSEARAVQELLSTYASSCHAGFVSTVVCSGLSWDSMKDTWANRRAIGSKTTVKCPLQGESIDRTGKQISQRYVQADLLKDSIDIIAGQVPMGSHEQWKDDQDNIVDVQYVVSLRSPLLWFVSSMVDKIKLQHDPIDTAAFTAAVKETVEADLSDGRYHEVYARYLITPAQISWIRKEEADLSIKHRVELSLTNLKKNNAIIVLSEQQAESLELLEYLIDSKGEQKMAFRRARRQIEKTEGDNALLTTILKALEEDKVFYPRLQEYLKYETQIFEQAKDMHQRQMQWLQKHRPWQLP